MYFGSATKGLISNHSSYNILFTMFLKLFAMLQQFLVLSGCDLGPGPHPRGNFHCIDPPPLPPSPTPLAAFQVADDILHGCLSLGVGVLLLIPSRSMS
jgi:hypothetical protein